jgi:hypothetical protein
MPQKIPYEIERVCWLLKQTGWTVEESPLIRGGREKFQNYTNTLIVGGEIFEALPYAFIAGHTSLLSCHCRRRRITTRDRHEKLAGVSVPRPREAHVLRLKASRPSSPTLRPPPQQRPRTHFCVTRGRISRRQERNVISAIERATLTSYYERATLATTARRSQESCVRILRSTRQALSTPLPP